MLVNQHVAMTSHCSSLELRNWKDVETYS